MILHNLKEKKNQANVENKEENLIAHKKKFKLFVEINTEQNVMTQNEPRVVPTLILLCERTNQSKPQHFNHNKHNIMRKTLKLINITNK